MTTQISQANIKKRIQFLIENPTVAIKGLNGLDSFFSNCHGTVAYILGLEQELRALTSKQEYLLSADGRPNYADRDLMKMFLETRGVRVKEPIFGDVVVLWSRVHRKTADMPEIKTADDARKILHLPPVKTYEHTAILTVPQTELTFHQIDTGRGFEYATIDSYIAKYFQPFRKRGVNLFVDFYRVGQNSKV